MKDLIKINFENFNKPPYWQQWLCQDDTLKLIKLSDKELNELCDKIIGIKDGFDLKKTSGVFLDRLGKLLDEPRNGNPDDIYRNILELKKLTNSAVPDINNIIRALKFLYDTDDIHMYPAYPAGLRITHSGEGLANIDFQKILARVIPAGVGYETIEIFNFVDEVEGYYDEFLISFIQPELIDRLDDGGVRRNAHVLYSGVDVLPTEVDYLYRDGMVKRDSEVLYNGFYTKKSSQKVEIPIYRRGAGIVELFNYSLAPEKDDEVILVSENLVYNYMKHEIRSGIYRHNGEHIRDSLIPLPFPDN